MDVRVIAAPLLVGALVAVGGAAAKSQSTVTVGQTKLGHILRDDRGRTLYLFEKDRHGKSACAGQCATFWPPLMTSGKPTAGKGVTASMLGTTRRRSGLQVTYNGHPLYRFSGDKAAGQTKGEGLKAFGAEWYALSARGSKVETKGS